MIKIIKIEKTKNSYNVAISYDTEIYNFKITEDLLIESRFLSLRELKEDEFKLFLSKTPLDSLILDGYKFLDKKMRSEKEIREHLREKTSSLSLIDECITVFKNKGLINDYEYFKTVTSYLMEVKKEGINKIYLKLNELGLNNFDVFYPIDILNNNIKELSIKYDLKNKDLPRDKRIMKCKIYLLQKGYKEEDINNHFKSSYIKEYNNEKDSFLKDLSKLKEKYKDDIYSIKMNLYKKGYSKSIIEETLSE